MGRGGRQLLRDLESCKQRWSAAAAPAQAASLRIAGSTVHLCAYRGTEKSVSLSIVFLMPDSYPNGPAMADCAEDAAVSAILSHINSFYESEGTLAQILSHIFRDLHTGKLVRLRHLPSYSWISAIDLVFRYVESSPTRLSSRPGNPADQRCGAVPLPESTDLHRL